MIIDWDQVTGHFYLRISDQYIKESKIVFFMISSVHANLRLRGLFTLTT